MQNTNTEKKYGVVLVGCGYIGNIHIKDIYDLPQVNLIGMVDFSLENAKKFAGRFGAESYSTDYHDYLEDPRVDIFIIATYTESHLPILMDCIAHGKHVLCEKPLTDNWEHFTACVEAIRNAKSKVLVGHVLRHSPTYHKIKDLIDSGAIGSLRVIRVVQNHHTLNWPRYHALLQKTSPVVDCGVHYIDLAQWLTGQKIIRVCGCCAYLDEASEKPNYGLLTMTLSDGAVAYFEAGWSKSISGSNVKEFVGTKGHIRMTMGADRPVQHEEGDLIEWYESDTEEYHIINMKQELVKDMRGQFEYLLRMIEEDLPADPSLDDLESCMKAAFAGDEAIKTGQVITLEP
jgi:predicted dehydrogenase